MCVEARPTDLLSRAGGNTRGGRGREGGDSMERDGRIDRATLRRSSSTRRRIDTSFLLYNTHTHARGYDDGDGGDGSGNMNTA